MKELLIIILIAGVGAIYYHDHQQTLRLIQEQDTNTQLQLQLTTVQTAYNDLLTKSVSHAGFGTAPPAANTLHTDTLRNMIDKESNPLDQKANHN